NPLLAPRDRLAVLGGRRRARGPPDRGGTGQQRHVYTRRGGRRAWRWPGGGVHFYPGISVGGPPGAQRWLRAGRRRPQHGVSAGPQLIGEAPCSRASSSLGLRQAAVLGNSSKRGARVRWSARPTPAVLTGLSTS